jgi:hypothetical protein
MNRLSTAIALAALVASPALAKSAIHKTQSAQSAYAQAPQYQRSSNNFVVAEGRVIGADPDLQIRSTLLRDHYTW